MNLGSPPLFTCVTTYSKAAGSSVIFASAELQSDMIVQRRVMQRDVVCRDVVHTATVRQDIRTQSAVLQLQSAPTASFIYR